MADDNPAYQAIRSRRVTRNMDGAPVDPHDLDLVVRAARYAPNAGNRRLQPVVAVHDPQMVRLLRMVAPGMVPRPQAVLVICIDERRAMAYGFRRAAPGLYIDVGTTAATLLLAAHALGLASCPVSSFSRAAVARLLGLEKDVTPQMLICLGHAAADQPAPMGARLAAGVATNVDG